MTLLNRVNLSIIWKYQIFLSRLWRSIATVWLNVVALGNPTVWVLQIIQLSQTSLISFEISVENNPGFFKRSLKLLGEAWPNCLCNFTSFECFYTCQHQSQISNKVQWNQSYIPFLVKAQQHSVHLLAYTHLYPDQTFELYHIWYLCMYQSSLMMINLEITVFFHLQFPSEYSTWFYLF